MAHHRCSDTVRDIGSSGDVVGDRGWDDNVVVRSDSGTNQPNDPWLAIF